MAAQCVALVSTLLTFAVARELRSDNPAKGIKKPPIRKMERFLSEEEISRLAAALDVEAEASGNPLPVAAIKLLLLTGARRGEIIGLQWQNVDFDRKCLRLPDSKTGAKDQEHDFGAFEADGHVIFFKIDYFDKTRTRHSPDAADQSVTERVITVMLAEEY